MTEHQIILQSYLNYYDWILSGEGPPVPEQDLLENDEDLDQYIEDWKKSLREGNKSNDSKKFTIG